MMMIQAVIFDVDGTLVDSVDFHAQAWCEAFSEHGREIAFPEMRSQIGKGADQLLPVFLSEEDVPTLGKKIEESRKEIFRKNYLPRVEGFPLVRELFQRLGQDGIRTVLASSAVGEELEAYKKKAKIEDLVADATSKDDAEKSKPHPDIFQAAFDKLKGVDRSAAVVVGDTPYDAEAACKSGLALIGVLCGGFAEEDLRKSGCSAVYQDPADLLKHYDTWTN